MLFDLSTRTRRGVAALLVAGVAGGGAVALAQRTGPTPPPAAQAAATKSTVPKSLTRAETAAEDVIGYLEMGQPAKSQAEARILRDLAHGATADALRRAGAPAARITALQKRADRTARLSLGGAPALQVSQAANGISELMPAFYGRYQDPVPPAVLELDYLDRQVQLDARAGDRAKLGSTVRQLETTWQQLRPQLVKAGGQKVATDYDRHLTALERGGPATAIQKQAVHGLDIVDQMEGVFLGK